MSWTIIVPIILVSGPGAMLCAYVLLSDRRRRRTPPELQGDWWSQFEREFRAYAEREADADPRARVRGQFSRGARDRKPPPR